MVKTVFFLKVGSQRVNVRVTVIVHIYMYMAEVNELLRAGLRDGGH